MSRASAMLRAEFIGWQTIGSPPRHTVSTLASQGPGVCVAACTGCASGFGAGVGWVVVVVMLGVLRDLNDFQASAARGTLNIALYGVAP